MLIRIKEKKNNILMELVNTNNNVIRQVNLVKDNEYFINPLNKRKENRGRKVILQEIIQDRYGKYAKVKYLDSLRSGKVEIDDLDHINSHLLDVNDNDNINGEINKTDTILEELIPPFQGYIDILNLMDSRKDVSNIAFITQREIVENVSVNPTKVSQRIKQLIRYGAIQQNGPGAYKLLFNDLWHTPYRTTHQVLIVTKNNPELNYKEQAELLKVSINDIASVWAYIKKIKTF